MDTPPSGAHDRQSTEYSRAAEIIREAAYLVAFTGAGVSVESGIPPFRGPGGIWERYNPRALDLEFFLRSPAESWAVIRDIFFSSEYDAQPNAAHRVLAAWEERGLLKAVVTQNIDNLHTDAGSREVVEYHGNTRDVVCLKTGAVSPFERRMLDTLPPRSAAGGVLKPRFVFFGESIPPEAARRAQEHVDRADVVLVVGSTGEVYPAAGLPEYASRRGATIIEVNPDRSAYTDTITDIHVQAAATEAISRLNELIGADAGQAPTSP